MVLIHSKHALLNVISEILRYEVDKQVDLSYHQIISVIHVEWTDHHMGRSNEDLSQLKQEKRCSPSLRRLSWSFRERQNH